MYKPHLNRFETNYYGASGYIRKDVTYDSKADWSLRYFNKDFNNLGNTTTVSEGKTFFTWVI